MRRLVIFGDSYVQGWRGKPGNSTLSEMPFGKVLGESLGCETVLRGRMGHSNLAIMDDVVQWIDDEDTSNDAFLVVWSDMVRMTVRDPNCKNHRFRGWEYPLWLRHYPDSPDPFDTMHDPLYARLHSMGAYHTVKNLCKEKNIPLRMTNSVDHQGLIDNFFESEFKGWIREDDPDYIEPSNHWNTLFDIISGTWLNRTKKPIPQAWRQMLGNELKRNKRLVTECWHPTDEANILIANTLEPYIKTILEE